MTARELPGDDALTTLAGAVGDELAMKLATRFGGVRLYVPRQIGEHHPICAALGREDADRLAAWAGGGSLDIPKQAARRERVRQLRSRGALTISQIALETSYTERHIYRLLRAQRDTDQPSLFDDLSS
ncbi:hypothetical protein [Novosphingobium sp. EMRT-2]|uniref:hypothetical protein n=1 Tax=Novosphingobium sp. EMRT-2 TaxID=2571749 RepID=UPI0010BD107C|nr:hypothetical protein [Novosphingobium sp. EMRT-2]QCI93448.1 hypothetical protein FA702_07660 [Novosphingobium sp. EMRT-2]